tara:strand:- start:140 stop:478 length:339 start_codon:yes stop_codon:yes gene_type:complete
MTEDRDPQLQALFAAAEEELDGGRFIARTWERISHTRAWQPGRGAALAVILCVALLSLLLPGLFDAANRALMTQMVPLDGPAAGFLFPLNSLAGLAALSFLAVWFIYRRMFG